MLNSPLHDAFAEQGAIFEDRAGYAVATHIHSPDEEGGAIRQRAGIWDHSDMAKIRVAGDGARETLERVVAGDIDSLPENVIRYTLVIDDAGQIITDVQIYNNFDEYLVTCGAVAKTRVLEALASRNTSSNNGNAEIQDVTADYAAICVEGPLAWKVPNALAGLDIRSLRLLNFAPVTINGTKALLSRIGYCGEYGYILFVPPHAAADTLERLKECLPEASLCGRDIQDLLRLEVRSFNPAKDTPRGETPLQAGLHWMINFRKDEFIGRDAVLAERDRGLSKKLVAFEFADPERGSNLGIIRDGGDGIGYAANYDFSPRRERTIGLAYLDEPYAWPGLDLAIDTADGPAAIRTVSAPFVLTESNKVQVS
jgi:aminomethyltransferase